MDEHGFLSQLANILDVDAVNAADNLRDFESWDSLSVLSIVAMADSKFGFTLTFQELKDRITAEELWKHFETKRTK